MEVQINRVGCCKAPTPIHKSSSPSRYGLHRGCITPNYSGVSQSDAGTKANNNNVQRVQKTPVFRILTMPYFTQTLKELYVYHIDFDDTIWPKFGRNLKDNHVLELLRGDCNMQANVQGTEELFSHG